MPKPVRNRRVIAFVSNSCWSLLNFRADVMQRFIQEGYDVMAIAPSDDHRDKLLSQFNKNHFQYYEINLRNSAIDPMSDLFTYWKLRSIYKQASPDLIFHYVTKPVVYGSIVARRLKLPSVAVITGLGYVYTKGDFLSKIVNTLFRFALKKVNKVWFLNKQNADFFQQQFIVPPNKINVLPGEGINTERFSPDHSVIKAEFTFIMVSRLLWTKGVGIYVEAASILKRKGIKVRCQLLGILDEKHPDAIRLIDLQPWIDKGLVEYLGASDEVTLHLQHANCLVAPTYYEEGLPRSIMEASSVELPVIATQNIGCTLLVDDGETGFLCALKDPEDLARKMEAMISLPAEHRMEMGRKGRKKMKAAFDKGLIEEIYLKTASELIP